MKMKLQLDTLNALALHLINDSLQTHLILNADFDPSTRILSRVSWRLQIST